MYKLMQKAARSTVYERIGLQRYKSTIIINIDNNNYWSHDSLDDSVSAPHIDGAIVRAADDNPSRVLPSSSATVPAPHQLVEALRYLYSSGQGHHVTRGGQV